MGEGGDARTTDSCCETVRYPRHPAVVVVTASNHRGDRENPSRVSRWEGTAFKRRLAATKECVVKRPRGDNVVRSFPASDRFHRQVNYGAIRISLPGKQSRTDLIRVVPSVTCNQQRSRQSDHFRGCNRRIKDIVDVVQVPRMGAKIGHGVRIGQDQSSRPSSNGNRGQQVAPLKKKIHKYEKNIFYYFFIILFC